ncbi:endonuclease [Candidatus Nomurabacteria bacterium RIFCSPHIGHO2_01_FULL_42_15]|uniref:Endonuclease n=1 Tax=Candidatus Nomurabacteria bacterium RIFCSPHIGHO2_01_FULL_42_15 TaxID=1801742 RepID=A0A1F6VGL8_9BACT|nr:MAG: endonuclease [Candidatus Nomurabacteria bacterium RIFCSPHIGHO2_01_FULL_42_15]OGI92885.1 MAG: endonuclease [Candidatus Nomurabacteria bacterium RIFCSPLOWO2_01_FULL_41_18]
MIVYALKNKEKRVYVGMTNNLMRRFKEHNSGYVFSTKIHRPWELLYTEEVLSRGEARKREKLLKSGFGKEFLKSLMPL